MPTTKAHETTDPNLPLGPSRIWSDIDLDKEGKQVGYLRLNHSVHEHGATWLPIPIAVFKSGPGPRILLLGGVHGDEYEGQVMLMNLIRTLEIANVRGHLIVLPAANAPAAFAGRRVSPIDNGNLNRVYPGDPDGSPTSQIGYFIEGVLLPKVEVLIDLHSGGSSLDCIPSAHVYHSPDKEKFARLIRMLEVFGMPTSIVLRGMMDHGRKIIGACDRKNVLRFSSELGGASRINVKGLALAEHGLARLLHYLGAVKEPMTSEPAPAITLMTRLPQRKYIYAPAPGMFQPYFELGDTVASGQPAGAIHFPEEPWRAPEIVHFNDGGVIYAIRALAKCILGDALYIVSVPWEE